VSPGLHIHDHQEMPLAKHNLADMYLSPNSSPFATRSPPERLVCILAKTRIPRTRSRLITRYTLPVLLVGSTRLDNLGSASSEARVLYSPKCVEKLLGKWPKASQAGSDMGNNRPIWVPSTPLGELRNPYFGILSAFPNSFGSGALRSSELPYASNR
jgi:hypothetical protein